MWPLQPFAPAARPAHLARSSVRTVSGPAGEVVQLAAAKLHCRIEHAADDALFADWIKSARQMVELESNRRLLTQTVEITLDAFPWGLIELPVSPVQSVSGVSYKEAAGGADTPLTGFQAWLSHEPPLLAPAVNEWWPAAQCGALAPVTITAVAGWPTVADVPAAAGQAILLTVGYWNSFRGDGKDPNQYPRLIGIPAGADRLIDLLRPRTYR